MEQPKFTVGQKVRFISTSLYEPVGTVAYVDREGKVYVQWEDEHPRSVISPDRAEKVLEVVS